MVVFAYQCVFLCFTCVFIGSSVSHISLEGWNNLSGTVFPRVLYLFICFCVFIFGLRLFVCLCACVRVFACVCVCGHSPPAHISVSCSDLPAAESVISSLPGLVTSKPRSGFISVNATDASPTYLKKIIIIHKSRQLSLHVDVAQQTCTIFQIPKVKQMFIFSCQTIFLCPKCCFI